MLHPTGQPRRYRNGLVNIDSFLADHDDEWKRLADLTRRARKPTLDSRRPTSTTSSRSTSARRPTCPSRARLQRPGAHGEAHAPRRRRERRDLRHPAADGAGAPPLLHRLVPGRGLARPLVRARRRRAHVRARARRRHVARALTQAVEATAPAAVREAYVNDDFESYYSSEPAAQFASEVFVNNVQVAIYAFAAGILLCGGHRVHPRRERVERRCRRGPVRGRGSVAEVLGADPPPRPARAVGRRHRRRRGPATRLGDHRSRATEPPRRARRAGTPVGRDHARADRRVRGRRHDRRLRDRQRTADVLPRRSRRRGRRRVLALRSSPRDASPRPRGSPGSSSEEDAAIRSKRLAPALVTGTRSRHSGLERDLGAMALHPKSISGRDQSTAPIASEQQPRGR